MRNHHFDHDFKLYYDLMANRVSEILLVSSPYDAFIMEEDGPLTERIIHEYQGLNLTRPPRITWVPNAHEAFGALAEQKFDLIITMPRLDDMDSYVFGKKIKQEFGNPPVFLLIHSTGAAFFGHRLPDKDAIDNTFAWTGNTYLLLAFVKSVEDRLNVASDTQTAKVRVIILVEDSPLYRSSILPLLYQEIVTQTQAIMEESLNQKHRIVKMRARPKILIAETFEQAVQLYKEFKPYVLSVFSDVRFPRNDTLDDEAGFHLLRMIREDSPDMPLLMLSSESANRKKANDIPAVFLTKNSMTLHTDIRSFLVQYLGFGDFVFRVPDGTEVARASNIRQMESLLYTIPGESIRYHAGRNHFSSWLMARSEIQLALKLRPIKASDFPGEEEIRDFLVSCLRERRRNRRVGVVIDFSPDDMDTDAEFLRIGKGSLGGKARGLAFMSTLLRNDRHLLEYYPNIVVKIPNMLIISTEAFDAFMQENHCKELMGSECSDRQIMDVFQASKLPKWLNRSLLAFLSHVTAPLAVRSSSLLEDAQYQSCAGIYSTYMVPNSHPDIQVRLEQLSQAIRLVYASTFLEKSRAFARRTGFRTEEEKMAIVLQQLTGKRYGDLFYPAISGVAQSYNYYPISHMKPEDGIAHLALGLGKTVVEGGTSVRFSPPHPQLLPQFSTVDDILKHSQRFFYALDMEYFPERLSDREDATLVRPDIEVAGDHPPIKMLASTYIPEEHRIRDTGMLPGHRVLTFASILKYNLFPLPEILADILEIGRKGMGCPVEIEFAVNLSESPDVPVEFALLQIRPMASSNQLIQVEIQDEEIATARCRSQRALGNGVIDDIRDIVFVNPETFDPARTIEQASEISRINRALVNENRNYLLIGPGRWGSADRWLGIPVVWNDISGVGVIIETSFKTLRADPSQGTHFFNNITSLGIGYITIDDQDFLDWEWLMSFSPIQEMRFIRHVQFEHPLTVKIDGKKSVGVVLE